MKCSVSLVNSEAILSQKCIFEFCQLPQFPTWYRDKNVSCSFLVWEVILFICLVIGLFGAKTDYFCKAVPKTCIIHRLRNPSKHLSAHVMIGWTAVTRRLSTQLSLGNLKTVVSFFHLYQHMLTSWFSVLAGLVVGSKTDLL